MSRDVKINLWCFGVCAVVLVAAGMARCQKSTWHELKARPTGKVRVCWRTGSQASHCTPPGDPNFLMPTYEEYRSMFAGSEIKYWTEPYNRPGFFTVGSYDASAPLRTNRQVFRGKAFLLLELAHWGATFANVQVTRNERQNPPVPRHGEFYFDAFAPEIFVSAAHFFANKYVCECVGDGAAAFSASWHGYNAVKGYYE